MFKCTANILNKIIYNSSKFSRRNDIFKVKKDCVISLSDIIISLSYFRYKDDVLSLNTSKISDYLDFVYPSELEIKDTTESTKSTSYLD